MNGRFVLGVLLAVVLIVGAVGVGVYAYNAGVAQGMIESGKVVAPATGVAPYPYYGGPFSFHPFGWGFGFLGCLFPLLFFFLFFGLMRAIFWGGRWGWRHHRHWENGAPPMVEEWHRKMHEQQTPQK
ncbi:MAG: hypothetical protein KGJ80_17360 [Chloroflexota bacterium]|nr:hypothetical protein [Chloroflexota bacterium]